MNLELDRNGSGSDGCDPGGHLKVVSQSKLVSVLDPKITDEPSESFVHECLHRDAVAPLHLIKASGQQIILVATRVDVLKKVEIVRTYGEGRLEPTPNPGRG